MWKNSIQLKSPAFQRQKLRVIKGQLPKRMEGRLFRNGPGILGRGNQVIDHWFMGNGAMLEVEFANGESYAQYRHIETGKYLAQEKSGKLMTSGVFKRLFNMVLKRKDETGNPANTSVMPIPNSNFLYALCEGGLPFKMEKKELNSLGQDNFGFLDHFFSAHPKIDPDNGDIFNFGMKPPFEMGIVRMSKELKLIERTTLKLRHLQSIHDCVLAGDYFILFQYPYTFDLKWFMLGYSFFDCSKYASDKYGTLVHIFDKRTLKKIDSLEVEPLFNFHFANGYAQKDKITLQYCRFDDKGMPKLEKFLMDYPKLALNKESPYDNGLNSHLEEMTIDLKNRDVKIQKLIDEAVEFPVVSDSLVGKDWAITYAAVRQDCTNPSNFFNGIMWYDRKTKEKKIRGFGFQNSVSEPVLIESADGNFLVTVVYQSDINKSLVYVVDAHTLEDTFVAELPSVIPPGYHGRWDYDKII